MAGKRNRSFRAFWMLLLLLGVLGASGAVTYYVTKAGHEPPKQVEEPKPIVTVTPSAGQPLAEARKVIIYIPRVLDNRFYLVPVARRTSFKGDDLNVAMSVLLGTTAETGESGKLIPPGTKLLEPVKVENGTAVVNLSSEFVDNFSGGSTQESLTLNSIVFTIVKNSGEDVKRVQILVEGKTVESLSGHFELTDPIEPDPAVLSPGSKD